MTTTEFRKITPWLIFVSCLAVLGLGATPFGPIADHIAGALKPTLLVILYILLVLNRFRNRDGHGTRVDLS